MTHNSTPYSGGSESRAYALFAVLVAACLTLLLPSCDLDGRERGFYPLCEAVASEYSLEPALVKAVIKAESGFEPEAVSPAGASGLMQIMPETFLFVCRKYGIETGGEDGIFDPETNIRAGCAYLRYLIDRFGDTETALAAYNAGEGTVSLWLGDPECSEDGRILRFIPYPETRNYVLKVVRLRAEYLEKD